MVFDVPTEGAKPGGEFKQFIDVLAQHVGTTFNDDPHIASKALRDGKEPEFTKVEDLKVGASFIDKQIWKDKYFADRKERRN